MKCTSLLLLAAGLLLCGGGCAHLDTTPEGDPNRVATGTVNVRMNLLPPPDAEVVVRVLAPAEVTAAPTAAAKDLVIGERGTRERPAEVLAEQVIRAPAAMPVEYRIEYHATDAQLRHGLNLDARISWGGRVRFRTIDAQEITLTSAGAPHAIWVEPAQ